MGSSLLRCSSRHDGLQLTQEDAYESKKDNNNQEKHKRHRAELPQPGMVRVLTRWNGKDELQHLASLQIHSSLQFLARDFNLATGLGMFSRI